MKKLKQLFLKKCNAVLIALLGMFGFSGCDNENGGGAELMYGVPQTDFVVKGSVVDKTERQGIEDIQVKILSVFTNPTNGDEHPRIVAVGVTNEDGTFKVQGSEVKLPKNARARFIDENGVFAEKTKEFDWEDAEQTRPESGSWNRGEFTKTLDTVQLTKRTDEDYDDEDGNETDE